MKSKYKYLIGAVAISALTASCSSSLLEEKPHAQYTPEFFQTPEGVQMGLTSLYSHTRYIYGQYFYNAQETGTDEYTWAQSGDNNNKDMDMDGSGSLTPSSSRSDVLWSTNTFSNINTATGIIENATLAGMDPSLIAEAQFWRGWDYFMLVQTFGGVPLDLGSGILKFNVNPSRLSARNTVPEVYTQAVFKDLKDAINNLPDAARIKGGVTKTAARLYLAYAYLTYAWWLENPNSIPTYPETPRTDPDGHDAAWYFQAAYDMAVEGIESAGGNFGLQPTYYDVNLGSNDRNNEIVLYSDHEEDEYYNQSSLSYSNGTAPENFASWFTMCNTGNIMSSYVDAAGNSGKFNSTQREAVQWGGRPWTRLAPIIEVFTKTFADKVNDSRYDGTFATVFPGNWDKNPGNAGYTVTNANGLPVQPGQAIFTFLDEENPAVVYPEGGGGDSGIGGGTLPGRADWVVNPSGISRIYYPGLWKLGTYRTDNGAGLGQPNGALTRPWNIAKFSEFFFIAAEAAVKGAATQAVSGTYANDGTARGLVNVIRARAGMWRYNNNGQYSMPNGDGTKIEDHSAEMIAATPATIDIPYLLQELSREYYGEGHRWFDLVRTQTWADVAGSYTICGTATGDHTPVTTTRAIDKHHYLRPIPQGQINGLEMSLEEKAAYQNPGYN